MIQATELRIGNYLQSPKGLPFEVLAHDIVFVDGGESLAEPIPLTEEWLLKFGFENNGQNIYDLEGWLPYLREMRLQEARWYQVFNVADCNVVYIHQLQNLYFALTGSELVLSTVPEATKPAL